MQWLKAAIARFLTAMGGATPMPPVGHVPPVRTTEDGNSSTAQATKPPLQPQSPVQAPSRKKPKAARQTTPASKSTSKKRKPAQTGKSQPSDGNSTQTPARRTRRHVK
jgi:hypothetical protein